MKRKWVQSSTMLVAAAPGCQPRLLFKSLMCSAFASTGAGLGHLQPPLQLNSSQHAAPAVAADLRLTILCCLVQTHPSCRSSPWSFRWRDCMLQVQQNLQLMPEPNDSLCVGQMLLCCRSSRILDWGLAGSVLPVLHAGGVKQPVE